MATLSLRTQGSSFQYYSVDPPGIRVMYGYRGELTAHRPAAHITNLSMQAQASTTTMVFAPFMLLERSRKMPYIPLLSTFLAICFLLTPADSETGFTHIHHTLPLDSSSDQSQNASSAPTKSRLRPRRMDNEVLDNEVPVRSSSFI